MRIRALTLLAIVPGLALLAAACEGAGDEAAATPTPSSTAEVAGELTREQAIQHVLEIVAKAPAQHADASTAMAKPMRDCETENVIRWEGQRWGGPPDNPSLKPVWVVKMRGEFLNPSAAGPGTSGDTPRSGTLISILRGNGEGGFVRFDEREHRGPGLSSEDVIARVMLEIGGSPSEDQADLHSATATRMTEREALQALEREGGAPDLSMRVLTDEPAWVVEVSGQSVDSCTLAPLQGRYLSVRHLDGTPLSSGFIPDPTATPGPAVELTQEQAIERVFELLANYLFYQPDASTATATRMTYGEALATVRREGGSPDDTSGLASDLPVWLVEVKGMNVKVGVPARYVFIINLHGGSEYDQQIPDATPTP